MKKKRLTTASFAFCISLIICLFSPLRLLADNSVTINMGTEHGTLAEKLGNDLYTVTDLTIVGQIDGDDLKTIRLMSGGDDSDHENLLTLNMFDAEIVAGGGYYSHDNFQLNEDSIIPAYCFSGVKSLLEITIPSSTKSVGIYGLSTNSLRKINLNEGLESLGWESLSSYKLESLYIPSTVNSINYAFIYVCPYLNGSNVSISEDNKYYKVKDNAIYTKDELKLITVLPGAEGEVILSEETTVIEGITFSLYDFKGTSSNVIVGKNVASVGDLVSFYGGLAFGASFDGFDQIRAKARRSEYSFYFGCTKVPYVDYYNESALSSMSLVTLYVPEQAISNYKEHEFWSHAKEILPIENTEYAYLKIQDYNETYPRRMVVEEGTGTWCGWCVRGIVAMDYMKEQYPDNFIGIAIHSSDKMDCSDEYGLYFEFYPGAYYNRSYYGSVSQSVFLNQIRNSGLTTDKRVVISQIEPTAEGIKVETKARFAKDISEANYRLIYVITEDNVGPYNQNNAYAGGGNGAMGGFENMGSPVSLIYNDVARSIYPDNQGLPGSVPSVLQSFTDYVYEAEVPLPDNYSDYENLSLTVMLYDVETGEILNADRQKLTAEIQGDDDVPDFDDQALALVLHLRSGKKIAYQLDEQPVVTFDDNNIVIETLKSAIRYNATDALKFTYINTEDSGIDNVEMPDYFISVVENTILARGLEPGTEMSVYSTDGLLVASKTVDLNGEASVLLPDLKGKVYLVKTSVTTFKIVMK